MYILRERNDYLCGFICRGIITYCSFFAMDGNKWVVVRFYEK